MRLKSQYIISIAIFGILLTIISASVIFTNQQVAQINNKEQMAGNIQTGASNLAYISNDYFLYQQSAQLSQWQNQFSSLLYDLSKLIPNGPEQQSQINNVKTDLQNLGSVFNSSVSFIEGTPRNESLRVLPAFQTDWDRLALQNQALTFDASVLSKSFGDQANQLKQTNNILILSLIGTFGAYFVAVYFLVYGRTLKSIAKLQDGTKIIGSGNLDHFLISKSNDEIGELSRAFNQMTINLKSVTASKTDLEEEIAERKKAEEELVTTKDRLAEELAGSLRLQKLGMIFVSEANLQALLDEIVFAAIEIMHADMGNMQQITKDGELRIVAQSGFKQSFLDFFNCVSDDSHAACAAAMASKKRVIVKDVTQSSIFLNTPALNVLLEAGVRAVVSTPFFTRSGEFLGIISTHFRSAREPDEFDLRLLDLLVRQAADLVERTQTEQKLEDYAKNLEKLVEERTKQLKDSERLAAIGATAGMVGHDIRNPLQAITGDVYLLKSELSSMPDSEDKESVKESLDGIEKNIDYINKIVADLQDFARPLKPNVEETDLKLIIDQLLAKNSLPENVKVSVKVETGKFVADTTYLNRILYNLVNNAVQAMPKGGQLTIHAYKDKDDINIAVKDTGVGIPNNVKNKLFTPMFTTKSKGQGFGLAVIKRMTEALDGTVTFESQEGKGTTFIVHLPPKK